MFFSLIQGRHKMFIKILLHIWQSLIRELEDENISNTKLYKNSIFQEFKFGTLKIVFFIFSFFFFFFLFINFDVHNQNIVIIVEIRFEIMCMRCFANWIRMLNIQFEWNDRSTRQIKIKLRNKSWVKISKTLSIKEFKLNYLKF